MAHGAERFAQAAARQRAIALVGGRDDRQVDVADQPQVLEAVVEQVDGGAEAALGEGAGPEAIRTDEHAGAGDAARQHQRLVAGPGQIGQRPHAVADDGDAVGRIGPAVAAREDRRPLAGLDQQARQASHDRRLAAAAAGDVADRNHRPGQALRPAGLRVAAAAPRRDAGIERAGAGVVGMEAGGVRAHAVTAAVSGTA